MSFASLAEEGGTSGTGTVQDLSMDVHVTLCLASVQRLVRGVECVPFNECWNSRSFIQYKHVAIASRHNDCIRLFSEHVPHQGSVHEARVATCIATCGMSGGS